MNGAAFKKKLFKEMRQCGFEPKGASAVWENPGDAIVLVSVSKGFGEQWFVNVGFFLVPLGGEIPTQVEKSHLYFRLERIFPQFRELILQASDLADPDQVEVFDSFLEVMRSKILPQLKTLSSLENLRMSFKSGIFDGGGLITKEARILFLND